MSGPSVITLLPTSSNFAPAGAKQSHDPAWGNKNDQNEEKSVGEAGQAIRDLLTPAPLTCQIRNRRRQAHEQHGADHSAKE